MALFKKGNDKAKAQSDKAKPQNDKSTPTPAQDKAQEEKPPLSPREAADKPKSKPDAKTGKDLAAQRQLVKQVTSDKAILVKISDIP